ncbi:hypothetical protein GCM10010313_30910 [Streptomyces violarus]|nr:hypothetical protein GCM10010313_30910 [Streptomyces violarus]
MSAWKSGVPFVEDSLAREVGRSLSAALREERVDRSGAIPGPGVLATDPASETAESGITRTHIDLDVALLDRLRVSAPPDDALAVGEYVRDDDVLRIGQAGATGRLLP